MPTDTLSPIMQQYQDAKTACPGSLVLFRVGDFYELFHDDAKTAAKVLDLTIAKRGQVTMAGFHHHFLDLSVVRLVAAGNRVAVCDPA